MHRNTETKKDTDTNTVSDMKEHHNFGAYKKTHKNLMCIHMYMYMYQYKGEWQVAMQSARLRNSFIPPRADLSRCRIKSISHLGCSWNLACFSGGSLDLWEEAFMGKALTLAHLARST